MVSVFDVDGIERKGQHEAICDLTKRGVPREHAKWVVKSLLRYRTKEIPLGGFTPTKIVVKRKSDATC